MAQGLLPLQTLAKMAHRHGEPQVGGLVAASMEEVTPIKSSVPISMTAALDDHPLVAEILLDRAKALR